MSLAAATFGAVSVLDKILLDRYMPGAATFIVLIGVLQLPGAFVALGIESLQSYPPGIWTLAVLSGVLWGMSLVLMLWVLSVREVSRVIPVFQISPVFVAILAVFFLSERLTGLHWLAILVTAAGAALISLRRTGSSEHFVVDTATVLLVLASALSAAAQFLSKAALEEMSLLNLYAVRTVALAATCFLIPLRPSIVRETRLVFSNRTGLAVLVLGEGGFAFLAQFLTLWAIELGPASLAVTVMASRPLFVLAISVALSTRVWRLLDEPLRRETLALKFASTAMIVGGISAITLL